MTPKSRASIGTFGTPRVGSRSSMKAKVKFSAKKRNPFSSVLNTPNVKKQILADVSIHSSTRPPSVLKRFVNDSESVHSSDSSKHKVNVKFRLPKANVLISPVPEDQQFIAYPNHVDDVEDIETNETIASSNISMDSSNVSSNSPTNMSKEYALFFGGFRFNF